MSSETSKLPAVNLSAGVQGIGTGNPGYAAMLEKNFPMEAGTFNVFAGIGWRSNESKAREVAGVKFSFKNGLTLGVQDDGKQRNPFVTFSKDWWTAGIYLVAGERPAYLVGVRL